MIQLDNISNQYDGKEMLKGINLSFMPGQTTVICGPSGSGKSTLIKTINGLEPISKGRIFVAGQDTSLLKQESLAKAVAMVFQDFGLFANKTVLENLVLPQTLVHGVDPEDAKISATRQLAELGLRDHTHKYPHQLSGGQQQRAAIGRALVTKPQFILMDEPTSALDPEMVGEVLNAIAKVAKSGMGLAIVTHEMAFAREVADRIVFMDAGKVVEVTDTEEFFTAPKSERARAFLSRVMR